MNGRGRIGRGGLPGLLVLSLACSARPLAQARPPARPAATAPDAPVTQVPPSHGATASGWAPNTLAPVSDEPGQSVECGEQESRLQTLAQELAARAANEGAALADVDELIFLVRKAGMPYVMPRLWAARIAPTEEARAHEALTKWGRASSSAGKLLCGLGAAEAAGDDARGQWLVAIQVNTLAELAPLPTSLPGPSGLSFEARLQGAATAAEVVVLPPGGAPHHVHTELTGDRVRARLELGTKGVWTVQLMATFSGGPRPVLGATVTVGTAPPADWQSEPVPGSEAYDADVPAEVALFRMLSKARLSLGLPPLRQNARLDQLARGHSRAMIRAGTIGHDVGQGNPSERLAAAGWSPKAVGENVALAQSTERLHRAIWASPSHRENLLLRIWDEVGLGVEKGPDGNLYLTELFVDSN